MLGIKERQRYLDIAWLMEAVDVCDVLDRLGVKHGKKSKDEVKAFCPDHHLFVNRKPSHPKWSCNTITGQTVCPTEPRGSNLLWTVVRVLGCDPAEAVKFMTGKDEQGFHSAILGNRISALTRATVEEVREPVQLSAVRRDLENRFISDACYDFFMRPPGKKPTNITMATVDRYSVFERRSGYYCNRAVIPFFMRGELISFCAIDMLGEKKWIIEHPLREEDEYRKVLYAPNSRLGNYLFGFDGCEKNSDCVIVTEGAREVMKLTQEGFRNAVACLKATVSDEQMVLLGELAPKEVVLMFDGDTAGYSATEKNAEKLAPLFKVTKCFLPIGTDPKVLNGVEIARMLGRCRRQR
jgi:hypothetical protein